MSDIQRWAYQYGGINPFAPNPGGGWVTYADHVAAVAAAEQRGREERQAIDADYNEGHRDGVKAARDAVERLPRNADTRDALAAIDALTPKEETT